MDNSKISKKSTIVPYTDKIIVKKMEIVTVTKIYDYSLYKRNNC